MKPITYISGLVLMLILSACGGGSPTGSTTNAGGDTGGPEPVTILPADLYFELDKSVISNSGNDAATLRIAVLDSNRNLMVGIPVQVSLSPNGGFQKSGADVTDSNGLFSGEVTIGGNKSNREIAATISVKISGSGTLTKTAYVQVTGSQVVLSPVPATPTPGQLVTLNIATRDVAGAPIPNSVVTISGTALSSFSVTTDSQGNAARTFVAPNSAASYTVVATALGISTTKLVEVASGVTSRPAAVGTVATSSLVANPSTILPNSNGSTLNRARLSAKFQTAANAGIADMRVRFEIEQPSLGNGEVISAGDSVVYTDAAGIAEADYISGTRSSPTNGVKVRACYSPVDFSAPNECPASVPATLTVAGTPLSISISDNNFLEKGLGDIAYIKKFLIQVNDAAGVAVKDSIVSASVDITHYGKGETWGLPYQLVAIPNSRDIHSDYVPIPAPANYDQTLQDSNQIAPQGTSIWCVNEDWNRNGFLDTGSGEDVNVDGIIQPRKAEIIVAYVNGNKTDANGQMLIQVAYGQDMGEWLAYTLRVTTGVAGSEGNASKSLVTDVLEGDVENGSFLTPPFGSLSCRSSN